MHLFLIWIAYYLLNWSSVFREAVQKNPSWQADRGKDTRVICTLLAHPLPLALLSYNFSMCRANTDSKICLSTCTSRYFLAL